MPPRRPLAVGALLLLTLVAPLGAPAAVGQEAAGAADPPWSVDEAQLAASLECPETFAHPEREPVLLVHGTFTAGREQFGWNYGLLLPERGFDFCYLTYPDRGFGDLQASAEHVAHGVLSLQERTGRKVDVMGHSQGGLLPRWAITFWPSVRAAVDDAVLVAPPSHGTSLAAGGGSSPFPMPAAFFQMGRSSRFIAALNAGDETPGDVSWSVLYSDHDALVQPVSPVPTAALDWGTEEPNTRNVRIQEVCPGRFVDHLTIGTTDRLSQELVLDAFANPGPVDPARVGPSIPLCALPDQQVDPDQLQVLAEQMQRSFGGGFSDMHGTDREPPLRAYAAAALAARGAPPAPAEREASAGPRPEAVPSGPAPRDGPAGGGASTLPATGGSAPLAAGAALLAAVLAGRWCREA